MTLYEANFIKLHQLVHDFSCRGGYSVSYSDLDCNLHLSIEGRSKYTCDLRLTYLFPDVGGSLADPDLLARVYFDARMAEVRTLANDHRHFLLKSLDRQYKREVDRCWVRNIMFSKWLEYLYEQGHGFEPVQPESPPSYLTVDSVKV